MQRKNIAIIDDEHEILNMLEKFLSRKGYSVRTFDNPVTAIGALSKDTDIILLYIMMPQMNGLDALPKLTEKFPEAKVLMMTAFTTLDKVLNAHRKGAQGYVMKPFDSLDALSQKIDEVLAKDK